MERTVCILWPPFSSDNGHSTARVLHWERGRPGRSERAARTARLKLNYWAKSSHLAALVAGATPAFSEQLEWSSAGTTKGLLEVTSKT